MRKPGMRPAARMAFALLVCGGASPTVHAQEVRLADKDVKALIEKVGKGADRFEDALDDQLKRSILRGPSGEVDVKKYLADFEDDIEKLGQRFRSEYAASAEALPVLQKASGLDRYLARQSSAFKGKSEWEAVSVDLRRLAGAYEVKFPLDPAITTVRRMNDREVAGAAEQVAEGAKRLGSELGPVLKADKSLDKSAREAALGKVKALEAEAKAVKSRVSDGQPATAEARQLMDKVAAVSGVLGGRTLSPVASASWREVVANVEKVAQAFDLKPPAR